MKRRYALWKVLNWAKMSSDSSRHQVNTPDLQSVRPRPYVFLQRWMWWTRLRSACWCMLIYTATEKPLSSYGNRFPSLIPTEWRGGPPDIATRFSILPIGVTLSPFPVKLGQSGRVGSFPSCRATSRCMRSLALAPRDKRVNEAVLGCFSASYPEVELSVFALLVGTRVGREQPRTGLIILAEIGFYFQTKWILPLLVYKRRRDEQSVPWMFRSICHLGDGFQSCECCQLSGRPHQMVMLKWCRVVLKKGKGPFCSLFAGNITVIGTKMFENMTHYCLDHCSLTSDALQLLSSKWIALFYQPKMHLKQESP